MVSRKKPAAAVKRAVKKAKPAPKAKAKAVSKKTVAKKPVAKKTVAKKPAPRTIQPLDVSALPPESVIQFEKWICLACVSDVFTRHVGLAPRTAYLQIKNYTPPVAELASATPTRPYFVNEPPHDLCPYCGSTSKFHTRLQVHRIESGKDTDVLRRQLVKSLPKTDRQFEIIEEKGTQQHAFFEWLEKISIGLDLDDPRWLRDVSRHYLSRREPKTDWQAQFALIHSIRRSRRLESGWEVDSGRLFLAPVLFDELLLIQYLVSRSHKAGGLTLEGRYTLPELFTRLRSSGYLRGIGIHAGNPADALEQLLGHLSGGETALKFYYIVDRRDLVEKMKTLKFRKPPKGKAR